LSLTIMQGYGQLPVATRFRPGGVGNPKGRPKRQAAGILIEAVPGLHRMAALADSNRSAATHHLWVLQDAARARGIELSIHQIARPAEIPVEWQR
jgi:hypothetical protein